MKELVVSACGGGTNSTAKLIRWVRESRQLDLVLFADTGAERPETYCHVEKLSHWLAKHGYPEVTTVRKTYRNGEIDTLEGQCLKTKTLPSYAYGFKSCSLRYKKAPQDKFINNWEPAKKFLKDGGKITKLIGYDSGEEHRVLNATMIQESNPSKKYNYTYPLYEWGTRRADCVEIIASEGIKLPGKSSCFFCPAMKSMEIRNLAHKYPELIERAIALERNAKHNLTKVKGLGRYFNWENFLKNGEMFPEIFPEPRGVEICCDCYDG